MEIMFLQQKKKKKQAQRFWVMMWEMDRTVHWCWMDSDITHRDERMMTAMIEDSNKTWHAWLLSLFSTYNVTFNYKNNEALSILT